jgi:uncharacterized protein (DUF1800 family)
MDADVISPERATSAPDSPTSSVDVTSLALAAALAANLAACGGGGGDSAPAQGAKPSDVEASRFLAQSSMGASRAQISRVQTLGFAGWLDEQFNMASSGTRWDWLVANGYADISHQNDESGFDPSVWLKLLSAPDTLRQRVTLALSEIFVVGISGLDGGGWPHFAAAGYLDMLEANAFGNHRTLLQQISLSPAMGMFLTFRGSAKGNATTGALPDENYARELMQLFTIGLVQLNLDGTPHLTGGTTTDTYGQDDITGLARVFTGWDFDFAGLSYAAATATPAFIRRPMVQVSNRYETGAKTFLGTTIASGTAATQCLTLALNAIFAHQNVGPFFCRQLIQRMVTSNPSPGYVERVAAVFNNDGKGVRGNLRAVVRAMLLDSEARSANVASDPSFGKLREPILRLSGWARAYRATSPSGAWAIGNTSDPATRLAQSPLRSASVFNFFRPGYVPPNSALGNAALVAPEFQIANESSVVGCLNFLQRVVAGSIGDITPDYSSLLSIANNAQSLVDEINFVLAANQLSTTTVAMLVNALQTMPSGTPTAQRNRVNAALVLVLAAPEFVIQK